MSLSINQNKERLSLSLLNHCAQVRAAMPESTAVSSVEQMAILTGDAALGAVQEGGEELMRVVNGGCEWW